jgi:hemerythrin-like domain-containing protein
MSPELDMTPMYVMHNALRREMEHLSKVTAGDDAQQILAGAAGWELFKKALHVHHTAEDEALWPTLQQVLADKAGEGDLELLAAMEAEHADIDPIVEAIDAAVADGDGEKLGDLVDSLVTGLRAHLKHEEDDALPLIQANLTMEQWRHFGQTHAGNIGPDAPRILPWLLDGADTAAVERMLTPLPEPARNAFKTQWQPAYNALDKWSASTTA